MGKIVVAGSINMDVVTITDYLPRPGQTVFGSDLKFVPGGKGSNQAVAASRLTDGVGLVGKLGKDAFGSQLHDFLRAENLDLRHLTFSDTAPTGTAIITVDRASENSIVVISGSNFEMTVADVDTVELNAGDYVVSVFEIPQETILAVFQRARAVGAHTILNPAPAQPMLDGLLRLVDYLVLNETELAFFVGSSSISASSNQIEAYARQLQATPTQSVIVTLGAKGAMCLNGQEFLHVPGREVKAVDTTGAGDCFVGALAAALAEGRDIRTALNFANVAASLSVQKVGASASLPYRNVVDAAIKATDL
jgi:ribokinase